MRLYVFVLMLGVFGANAASLDKWNAYEQASNQLLTAIESQSFRQVAKQANQLVVLAEQDILPAFAKLNPVCKEYVSAIIAATPEMLTLSQEEIEKDYHADGKLPAMKDAVCYHAKDMLVHPATVYVLANTQSDNAQTRTDMKHEMVEVIEHFKLAKPSF